MAPVMLLTMMFLQTWWQRYYHIEMLEKIWFLFIKNIIYLEWNVLFQHYYNILCFKAKYETILIEKKSPQHVSINKNQYFFYYFFIISQQQKKLSILMLCYGCLKTNYTFL